MRRSGFFWGTLIILIGVLFLLDNLGLLPINAGELIFPLALILAGLWLLLGRLSKGQVETLVVPIETESSAEVRLKYGAGQLEIGAVVKPGELLSGNFGGGVESEIERASNHAQVTLRTPSDIFFGGPWNWDSHGLAWQIGLTPELPISLSLETGASESLLSLEDLKIERLWVKTGASSARITTPAHAGFTRIEVESGAASVDIRLPEGVAGRILVKSGLASINIDTNRFPKTGDIYQSPGYDTHQNRADIHIQTGVGSVSIA